MSKLRDKVRSTGGVAGTLVSFRGGRGPGSSHFYRRLTDYNVIFNGVNDIVKKLQDQDHEVHAAGQPMLTGWVYHYQQEMYFIFGLGLLPWGVF